MADHSGLFVTFEGGEGAGKSTQMRLLAERLRHGGHRVIMTREPGGSPGAEAVRHVLLSGAAQEFGVRMEAILFAAARHDHVEEVIRPALESGAIVLCDRFIDSTRVYQGVTGNLEPDFIDRLQQLAVDGVMPDCTLILDLPAELGLARARSRTGGAPSDRFEREELEIHETRRQAFLEIAAADPTRCRIVPAMGEEHEIAGDIAAIVAPLLTGRDISAAVPVKAAG